MQEPKNAAPSIGVQGQSSPLSRTRVLTEEGNPLVVYRGELGERDSAGELQTRLGSLSFGTLTAATLYATEPNELKSDLVASQAFVIPALLDVRNPLVDCPDDPFIDFSRLREALGDTQARRIALKFSSHIENTGNWQDNFREAHPDISAFLEHATGEDLDQLYMMLFPILDDPFEVSLLQAAGFDGAIYGGCGATATEPEYRVFSEDQVIYPLSIGWPAAPERADVVEQHVPALDAEPQVKRSSVKAVREAIADLIGGDGVRLGEGLGRLVVTTSRELAMSGMLTDGYLRVESEALASLSSREGFQRMLAEQRAAKKRAIDAIGDVGDCAIVRQQDGSERWQMILRDASESGKWRTQSFDRKGFSGHMVYATRDLAIEAAATSGFTQRDDLALDRIQDTPEFQRGLFATDLIGLVNSRVITFEEANVRLVEYDRIEAARHSLALAGAQAFITQGTIYLLADQIEAGDEKGVYLHEVTHRYGRPVLGAHGWSHVLGTLKGWAGSPQGSIERSIHDAALRRALSGSDGRADVFDEELFAYSVEEAVRRGIMPSASAHPESAEAWLDDVAGMLQGLVQQMLGRPVSVISTPQDLVDLAYALAQIENPGRMQRVLQRLSPQEQAVLREMVEGANLANPFPDLRTHVLLHVPDALQAGQWAQWAAAEVQSASGTVAEQVVASGLIDWFRAQPADLSISPQEVSLFLARTPLAPRTGALSDRGPNTIVECPGPFTDWLRDQRKAAFARWTSGLPVVGEHEYPSTYLGGPAVFEVFHGTTHTGITEFKRQGSRGGFLGKGPYFSTNSADVSANYAGIGPDATSNLEEAQLDILRSADHDIHEAASLLAEYFKAVEISTVVTDDNADELWDEHRESAAMHHARSQLLGASDGLMMKAFVKLERPLDTLYGRMTYERIFDEEGDLRDEQGSLVDWILAARRVGAQLDAEAQMEGYIDACLKAVEDSIEIEVKEVFDLALQELQDIYEDGEGLSAGGVVAMIAEELGYDGIVMDAWKHFGRRSGAGRIVIGAMRGLREETLHVLPFSAQQVKSATGNRGTFDPNSPDIRFSNLKPDMPTFVRWFGQSKVVDDEGKPLVMYHGTRSDFTEFGRGRWPGTINDIGSWFASDAATASMFAGSDGGQVMPVYLSIQKPLYIDSVDELHTLWAKHAGGDARLRNGDTDNFRSWLRRQGHDGLVISASDMDPSFATGVYMVPLDSTQIRSVIGNQGHLSAENPDSRFSRSPETLVSTADLPPDMQDILGSFFEEFGERLPAALATVTLPLNRFPDVPLADGLIDERGIEYARAMIGAEVPPVIVYGDLWLDGRHRVWAAKQGGKSEIKAFDISAYLPREAVDVIAPIADLTPMLERSAGHSVGGLKSMNLDALIGGFPSDSLVRSRLAADIQDTFAGIDALSDEQHQALDELLDALDKAEVATETSQSYRVLVDKIGAELDSASENGTLSEVVGPGGQGAAALVAELKTAAPSPDVVINEQKAFQDWFKNSKVVAPTGEPLLVYHGSPDSTFNAFDPTRAGTTTKARDTLAGFFFTDDKDFALHFTERRVFDSLTGERIPMRGVGTPGIKEVYLSLQNPLDLRKITPEVAQAVASTKAMGRFVTPQEIIALGSSAEASKEIQMNVALARPELEALGFDGIINKVKHQGRVRTEFIAFRPEQIKSASANRGTFDSANPDIRFSRRDDGSQGAGTPSEGKPNTPTDAAFIGYLAPDGQFECYPESKAREVDYHHSMLVKDLDAYDAEGGLTFVRMYGGPVMSIKGSPAMDPYSPESSLMVSRLARRLLAEGADPDMPLEAEDMGFTRTEAPYQGKLIGTLREWSLRNQERAPGDMSAELKICDGLQSMEQLFPTALHDWFGASRVTVDGQAGGVPLMVFRGSSEGDEDLGSIDPVGGLAAKPMEVFWATSSRMNASFFAEDEIQNLYIKLENPLVLRDASPSPAAAVKRILAEVRAGRANWDGVIFEDIVDGSHPSVVYAVFPREDSVREQVRIVGRTRYDQDGTPVHEGLMPSPDPVSFDRGDEIRHDDDLDHDGVNTSAYSPKVRP